MHWTACTSTHLTEQLLRGPGCLVEPKPADAERLVTERLGHLRLLEHLGRRHLSQQCTEDRRCERHQPGRVRRGVKRSNHCPATPEGEGERVGDWAERVSCESVHCQLGGPGKRRKVGHRRQPDSPLSLFTTVYWVAA